MVDGVTTDSGQVPVLRAASCRDVSECPFVATDRDTPGDELLCTDKRGRLPVVESVFRGAERTVRNFCTVDRISELRNVSAVASVDLPMHAATAEVEIDPDS